MRLVNPLPFDREILRSELLKRKEYLMCRKKAIRRPAMFKNHQEALHAENRAERDVVEYIEEKFAYVWRNAEASGEV